jgi:hypothetical protein
MLEFNDRGRCFALFILEGQYLGCFDSLKTKSMGAAEMPTSCFAGQ